MLLNITSLILDLHFYEQYKPCKIHIEEKRLTMRQDENRFRGHCLTRKIYIFCPDQTLTLTQIVKKKKNRNIFHQNVEVIYNHATAFYKDHTVGDETERDVDDAM